MPGDPRFFAILDEIRDIHIKKSFDYGTGDDFLANVRASEGWGIPAWVGTMIRANDKIIRLQSLLSKGKLENESARDSLIDLASYAIIALILMEEEESEKEESGETIFYRVTELEHQEPTSYEGWDGATAIYMNGELIPMDEVNE